MTVRRRRAHLVDDANRERRPELLDINRRRCFKSNIRTNALSTSRDMAYHS